LLVLKQKLTQLMVADRVFLTPDLTLPALAQQAGISVHDLSYVLNEGFGENFFQFVNRYRVEEAKRLLTSAQHRHLSILGIAFEAGFSSKTTFNTTFKKLTGQSPSDFARSAENGSTSPSIA
jgi:AraC-like DNA-binding protein